MWVATAIASEENQAAVGKPVGQKQVLAKKEWRPQRDLNPAQINKKLGFFGPKVAQSAHFGTNWTPVFEYI